MRSLAPGVRRDLFDAALAIALLAASLSDLFAHVLDGTYPHSLWAHLPFAVATSVPVAFRRRRPLAALIAMGVVQSAWIYALFSVDQQPPLMPYVQLLIVVYSAAAYSDGRAARSAWVVFGLGIATDVPMLAMGKSVGEVASPDIALVIAFLVGLAFARSRRHAEVQAELVARAERDRQQAVERAATEERARIARELHDVISHDVSMMVMQASIERRLRGGDDDATAQTLANIESVGREALTELRRMLGVLRKSEQSAPLAPLAPQPGLAEVPILVEQARAAGLPVELVIDGQPVAVPPGLDIAAYRIVQESLTNVAKHAAGAAVTATLRYCGEALEIDVVDNGSSTAAAAVPLPQGGHGLIGMQERVALFGGDLEATRSADGGFRVRARLPLPA